MYHFCCEEAFNTILNLLKFLIMAILSTCFLLTHWTCQSCFLIYANHQKGKMHGHIFKKYRISELLNMIYKNSKTLVFVQRPHKGACPNINTYFSALNHTPLPYIHAPPAYNFTTPARNRDLNSTPNLLYVLHNNFF